jgi:hypothetical protein
MKFIHVGFRNSENGRNFIHLEPLVVEKSHQDFLLLFENHQTLKHRRDQFRARGRADFYSPRDEDNSSDCGHREEEGERGDTHGVHSSPGAFVVGKKDPSAWVVAFTPP